MRTSNLAQNQELSLLEERRGEKSALDVLELYL
jgi:hypothetical protein